MPSIFDRPAAGDRRWPRGQKFRLSTSGEEAEASYQGALESSRKLGGRGAFDEATRAWAETVRVRAEDGPYLSELRRGPKSVPDLVQALEDCGASSSDVKAALDRLITAGLVTPEAAEASAR